MQTQNLISWFDAHARELPWRKNRSPYRIWISEVMLQQTQVKQAIPYYHKFLTRFPDIKTLALADQQEVLRIWQGMGYYARARNLHRAAKIIMVDFAGEIPDKKDQLLKLPGFGAYITNAVLSLAFAQPYAVLDGNVIRVISRVLAIRDNVSQQKTRTMIQARLNNLIDKSNPGKFNEAMMELGATVCHPVLPDCAHCPLNTECIANKNNLTSQIPVKSKKVARPVLELSTYIMFHRNQILLVKRPEAGLLGDLWEFPTFVATNSGAKPGNTWSRDGGEVINAGKYIKSWGTIRHGYTHFQIRLTPSWYRMHSRSFNSDFYTEQVWINPRQITGYPMHRAAKKVIDIIREDLKIIPQ